MSDSHDPAINGGVNVDAEKLSVGQDLVGRDKAVSAGGHIIHAEAGATVVVNERAIANTGDRLSREKTVIRDRARVRVDDSKRISKVDFAIVTATTQELKAMVDRVGSCRKEKVRDDNHVYYRGKIRSKHYRSSYEVVMVTLRHQGTKEAAATTTQVINTWQPHFVFFVGIAGGIKQDDLTLGDVVIADQVYDYEFDKIGATRTNRPRMTPASAELMSEVRSILLDDSWAASITCRRPKNPDRQSPKYFVGPIGSGDKLVASTTAQKRLLKHCPKMLAVEMEAAGFVPAAEGANSRPSWLVIRGISDMADQQKDDRWQPYAAATAAAFACTFISGSLIKPLRLPAASNHRQRPKNPILSQEQLLDEVYQALDHNDFRRANKALQTAIRSGLGDSLVRDMLPVVEFTQARAQGHADDWLDRHAAADIVSALVTVLTSYEQDARFSTGIDRLLAPALADLAGRAEYVSNVYKQLRAKPDILTYLAFVDPLKRLSEDVTAPQAAKQNARQLLIFRSSRRQWLTLWSKAPADPTPLADWLRKQNLRFNPFGPLATELDRYLPEYAAYHHVDLVRGARPIVAFAEVGAGRTATAMLHALECDAPPESPREAATLPVYFHFDLINISTNPEVKILAAIARATAHTLLRFLLAHPSRWLDLPSYQYLRLGTLLLTYAGSKDSLLSEMRQIESGSEYRRLVRAVEDSNSVMAPRHRLDKSDWLDLLSAAFPAEYKNVYVLADVETPSAIDATVVSNFQSLLSLTVPLAANSIYLKIFAPETLRKAAGNLRRFDCISLTWDKASLSQTLKDRWRRAGGDSLAALCGPDVPGDVDQQLVRAALNATDSPRQLVRLGNQLLLEHARHAADKPISFAEISKVLGTR